LYAAHWAETVSAGQHAVLPEGKGKGKGNICICMLHSVFCILYLFES